MVLFFSGRRITVSSSGSSGAGERLRSRGHVSQRQPMEMCRFGSCASLLGQSQCGGAASANGSAQQRLED